MIKSASLSKEIAVTVVNKIGILADMSKILSSKGVNIEAVAGYAMEKEARIMLVSNDNASAIDALRKSGYNSIVQNEVIVLELENKPGVLKIITAKLATEGVDIKYIYGTTCAAACPAKIILSTSDNNKALLALKK